MNEKVTVRSLIRDNGIDKDYTPLPTGLIDNGWVGFLPIYDAKLFTALAHLISKGLTKIEVLEEIEKYLDEEDFLYISERDDFETEEEKEIFLESYQREVLIKERLEKRGYFYPRNIKEALALLIEFNILIETSENNIEYLDLSIKPFPNPVDYLDTSGYLYRLK